MTKLLILILTVGFLALPAFTRPIEVVGYLPDYRVAALPEDVGQVADFIIYFSMEPDPDNPGQILQSHISSAGISKVRNIKNTYGTKILISLGGWARSAGFAAMTANAATRAQFITNLLNFCTDNNFDGADYDWEFPQDNAQRLNYARLIIETKTAFEPHGYLVSAALNPYQELSSDAFDVLDHVHVMSYDNSGQHSTYRQAKADVNSFLNRGVAASKIFLGVPFYGRHVTDRTAWSYAQIQQMYHPGPEIDQVAGIYFNGIETIRRKTQYAVDTGLGGIMIWELGQDTNDETSLLQAIDRQRDYNQIPPPPDGIIARMEENGTALKIEFEELAAAAGYRLIYGSDPAALQDSLAGDGSSFKLTGLQAGGLYYFRLRAIDSLGRAGHYSRLMTAGGQVAGAQALIVNDYSTWNLPDDLVITHAQDFQAAGYRIASADGQAVAAARVGLDSVFLVDWFCADAGKFERTIDQQEMQILKNYLEQGGNLLLSGSNIGYDFSENATIEDRKLYWNYFKARYIKDAPDDQESTFYRLQADSAGIFSGLPDMDFDDGNGGLYNVKDPDVLRAYKGGLPGYTFSGATFYYKNACVYYEGLFGESSRTGRIVHLSVPYETLSPQKNRRAFLQRVDEFFNAATDIVADRYPLPRKLALYPNFPNPFNSLTAISYRLPAGSEVTVTIHDLLGRTVAVLRPGRQGAGLHRLLWEAGSLSSGTYFYTIRAGGEQMTGRPMILIK